MVAHNPQHFGERLRRLMTERPMGKVSVAELADRCGVSYQAAKKWIEGPSPKLDAIYAYRAALLLGVSVEQLLTGNTEQESRYGTAEPAPEHYKTAPQPDNPNELLSIIHMYLGSLDNVLIPSAIDIIKKSMHGEIDQNKAASDLAKLQAASLSLTKEKRTGT